MQVCSTIKCQIDGSLVIVYFSESVGSKCWMLNFTLIFFGLLPKRLCWGPCWWWFTRNIWPKARVACIFCYVWTHLYQTHCSSAVSNSKFLLFMLVCKVLTTQVLTCSLMQPCVNSKFLFDVCGNYESPFSVSYDQWRVILVPYVPFRYSWDSCKAGKLPEGLCCKL